MPKITINGQQVEVADGSNIIAAAEIAGLEIPHYCYHPGLSVAGNCRMCLVEIKALSEKQPNPLPKLQIACNTVVQEGMIVEISNDRVQEARRGVLEFLLINHPIDCPICDQAGECKLQEYYMDYGRYGSRFPLEEKVNKAKAIAVGPSIMLDQERCILCTRCVRFLDEVTGTNELLVKERGDRSEIDVCDTKQVDNPYATNIVDICPVGALTSRDFRFQARVWYLDSTPSICPGCSTGCNIDVHTREDHIYRLKPRANHNVNGFWMCDEGRNTHRLIANEERLKVSASRRNEEFSKLSWGEAAKRSAGHLASATSLTIFASAAISTEEAFLLTAVAERIDDKSLVILSPENSEVTGDDLLISSDRFANRQGLLEFGFSPSPGSYGSSDAILAYRCDPAGETDGESSQSFEEAAAVMHVSDQAGKITEFADEVIAVASHFEIDGSYINRDHRLQFSTGAVAPVAEAVAGWRVLAVILSELGGPKYASLDQVTFAMSERLGGSYAVVDQEREPAAANGAAL